MRLTCPPLQPPPRRRWTKQRRLAHPAGPRILNINSWNEWTEGSYLEPDMVHGLKYLEAVRDVLGAKK